MRFFFGGRRFAALVEDLGEPTLPQQVTPAERAVAALVCRGRSNAEIARSRGTSTRTVANQVASLMRKLAVGSRVELALRLAARSSAWRECQRAK
jgi:DNA-binding NarL/FixJ family response regulator